MEQAIKIQRISGPAKQLDCGNDSINKKLEEAYFADMLRQGYTYEISVADIILGYYMITFRKYIVGDWKAEEMNYASGLSESYFTLHLQYILVDKKYQKKGIGTVVLKKIISDAKKLSNEWPIRFLTLNAVSDKYKWYEKCGFLPMNDEEINNSSYEIGMFLDCIDDKNKSKLNEYISSNI